ncbi:hypothetical protein [Helicobacter macacae]|uniref:hypothetical protein n=1 Tax=Helicobacter macacae TaxID=398626 RepID=UPI00041A5E7D|nr:hypothetical protein [Helicobacter macacae]
MTLLKPPPSAEGVWGWVDTTFASQVKSATASNANISIANKANANTSVITKETSASLCFLNKLRYACFASERSERGNPQNKENGLPRIATRFSQ